jgi:AcrR family transcriptional regulator
MSSPRSRPSLPWLREPPSGRQPVDREAVVRAAIAVADTEGLDAVSMRRVARELGVGTMTLYSYVHNKDELLDLMGDEVMGEQLFEGDVPTDWRQALTEIARRLRRTWLRHPWVGSTLGRRPAIGPNSVRHFDQSAAAVAGLDVDARTAFSIVAAVDEYAMGFSYRELAEQEFRRNAGMSMDEWRKVAKPYMRDLIATGAYPNVERFIQSDQPLIEDPDRFELGLRWLLDGIEASLPKRRKGRPKA